MSLFPCTFSCAAGKRLVAQTVTTERTKNRFCFQRWLYRRITTEFRYNLVGTRRVNSIAHQNLSVICTMPFHWTSTKQPCCFVSFPPRRFPGMTIGHFVILRGKRKHPSQFIGIVPDKSLCFCDEHSYRHYFSYYIM